MGQAWFYSRGEQKVGPVSAKELKRAANAGELQPGDLVWTDGMMEWREARTIKGLEGAWTTASAAPPLPVSRSAPVAMPKTEARLPEVSTTPTSYATVAQQGWLIGVSVLCCFPVGLILVWLHPRMSQTTKWIITSVVGVFVLAIVAANLVKPQGQTDKSQAKDEKTKDRYTAPYDDFDGESDRLLRSDDFLSKPAGAKDLTAERLTGDFLPFSPGAESYYQQYAFLGGIAWTEDRKEDHPDGSVRQFTTTFGLALGDGTRRTTKKDFPGKESVRYRRREREGRIEFGMESVAGQGVVHWTPLIKLDARLGDSWPSYLGDTDKSQGMTRLANMFEFDGRPCAVIVEETDQGVAANGRSWRARNGYWLLKGIGIVRHEVSNDLEGSFKAASRSMLEVRKFGK